MPPGDAAVVREEHARRRDRKRELVRLARPRHDRVKAKPSSARLPGGPARMLPEPTVERPALATVTAFEQHAGIAARVEHPLPLGRHDHPDPLERFIAALR